MTVHTTRWQAALRDGAQVMKIVDPLQVAGRITRVTGLMMEAAGLTLPIGAACRIQLEQAGERPRERREERQREHQGESRGELEAEVVGFRDDRLFLMPQGDTDGVLPGARVLPLDVVVSTSFVAS